MESAPKPEVFYAGALGRIRWMMLSVGLALTVTAWLVFGWRAALGFLCGCAVSYVNFQWLKRAVTAMADKIVASGTRQSSKGVVVRFLLRYVLLAIAAYAILTVSPASLHGLLAGLFLPVAAIACEAAYELYVALARGI